jgi:hypothetical protein
MMVENLKKTVKGTNQTVKKVSWIVQLRKKMYSQKRESEM